MRHRCTQIKEGGGGQTKTGSVEGDMTRDDKLSS